MIEQEEAISRLCKAVEVALDRKMLTPKDFTFLADAIFEKLHKSVSPTTLKRLWGYLSEPVIPRVSTLDIISEFLGYDSWAAFCQQDELLVVEEKEAQKEAGKEAKKERDKGVNEVVQNEPLTVVSSKKSFFSGHRIVFFTLILLTFITASWALYSRINPPSASKYILARGEKFETYNDYLTLFGITDTAFYWGRTIPHHPNIAVWGPEFQHPRWHNYGDPNQMMPTITERWEPEDADSTMVAMRNYDNYYHELRVNEVRLTFMKNLVDNGYVFLGVYRMDLTESDSTHCVWERVADECDLNNLDYLEKFRN